ncbi:MAG: hypothetical protein U0792_15555 [Gemmataceae bacterium]
MLSPSSYGLHQFVVVTDPEMRKKLHAVSYNQAQFSMRHTSWCSPRDPPTPADVERYGPHGTLVRGPRQALEGFKNMAARFALADERESRP